jgi:hypothetical protein
MKSKYSANMKKVQRKHWLLGGILVALTPSFASAGISLQIGDEGTMNINYAVQLWSQYRSYSSPTNSGSSFDTFLRRNRVTFSGQFNDMIGYYAQLEAGGDSRNGVHDRPVFWRDAYLTLDYSDGVRFIAGRFKNTFSRENLEACFEPLTIDRAESIAYTPFGGTRDTGYAIWGNLADAAFQYRFMLSDGREGEANNVPKDSPRYTARVHWSPLDPEYDYGYRGSYLGTSQVFTIGLAYDYQPNVAYADFSGKTDIVDYTAFTADVFWEQPTSTGVYTLSAAYFDYDTENAINKNPDPTLPVNSQLEAVYAKGAYMFPNKVGIGRLQVYFRYEDSDYALQTTNLDRTWAGGGVNYYIDGQRLRVTAEFASITFDEEDPTNASLQDYAQFTTSLQLIF